MDVNSLATNVYKNAQYVKGSSGDVVNIKCDINGATSFVPIDPANADYQRISALVAQGKFTIAPAT